MSHFRSTEDYFHYSRANCLLESCYPQNKLLFLSVIALLAFRVPHRAVL